MCIRDRYTASRKTWCKSQRKIAPNIANDNHSHYYLHVYVCVCKKVTEGKLKDSLQKSQCLDTSQKSLGFSTKCGKCKSSVESLFKNIQFRN